MSTVTETEQEVKVLEMSPEQRQGRRLFYRRNKANRYLLQDPHKFDTVYDLEGRPLYGFFKKKKL